MVNETITLPTLSIIERRILGVLVEKAKTTPEVYPMSLNALMNGCNQKSNRDPIMNLDEVEVEETLGKLQQKGLVIRVTGNRVDRWRQSLYEVWAVNKEELAVLAELLLRGPQTIGELRSRVARMEPIDTLEQLRDVLKPLVDRKMVQYLTAEKARGAMVTHGFHLSEEFERIRSLFASGSHLEDTVPGISKSTIPSSEQQDQIQKLSSEVAELRTQMQQLVQQIEEIKKGLGM